jgi:hypothetical protein
MTKSHLAECRAPVAVWCVRCGYSEATDRPEPACPVCGRRMSAVPPGPVQARGIRLFGGAHTGIFPGVPLS